MPLQPSLNCGTVAFLTVVIMLCPPHVVSAFSCHIGPLLILQVLYMRGEKDINDLSRTELILNPEYIACSLRKQEPKLKKRFTVIFMSDSGMLGAGSGDSLVHLRTGALLAPERPYK